MLLHLRHPLTLLRSDAGDKEPCENCGDDRRDADGGQCENDSRHRANKDDDTEDAALHLLDTDKSEDTGEKSENAYCGRCDSADVEGDDRIDRHKGRSDTPSDVNDADNDL